MFFIYTLIEEKYGVLFNKPFFIHFYPSIKKLNTNQLSVLSNQFDYYNSLSDKRKKYFQHRVATFVEKYEFIGKEGFVITDEVTVLVAATSIMLTFGLRNYLYSIINKIVIYPSQYYSEINDAFHKGEFNPMMKAVVFSWYDFKAGYEIKNDNLNLGIHEFAHVLHFHGTNSQDTSAIIFARIYNQIQKEVNYPANRERLIQSEYFRIYAFTNQFEFLAVIIEHYFETPHLFKIEFPQLFEKVSCMLNHKHIKS